MRGRQFAQKREQDRARAGAEIEEAQRRAAVRQRGKDRTDQRLRVLPRVEDRRIDREMQAPELAVPEDARDRLAGEPAGGVSGKRISAGAYGPGGRADQRDVVEAAGGADEDARVEVGSVATLRAEQGGEPAPRRLDRKVRRELKGQAAPRSGRRMFAPPA